MNHLVPTVITNKRGIVTTVYRKPSEASAANKLAPVAMGTDKSLYALRKALHERIKKEVTADWESTWRKRAIKDAVAKNDLRLLQRLDKYFDVNHDMFHGAFEVVNQVDGDRNDDVLFHQAITLQKLTPLFASADKLSAIIPLVQSHPKRIEEIAHCWNVISTKHYRAPMAAEVEALFNAPHSPSKQLPMFLASSVELTETPVQDYRIVSRFFFEQDDYYAYRVLEKWDRQAVAYMAGIARGNRLHPDFAKRFKTLRDSPREAVDYCALINSVTDLFGSRTTGREPHLRGPNAFHIDEVMRKFKRLPESTGEPYALETVQDLSLNSAYLRFMMTSVYERAFFILGTLPKNRDVVALLREHNSPEEVNTIVALFNDRGIDPEMAKDRLKDHQAAAISSGWL